MPVGIYTQYNPNQDEPLSSPNMPQLQLPNRQVDPFMRTLLDLQDAGLLSQRFMQDQIANPIMRQKFYDSGVVGPRQPFGPGQAGLTEDEREKLKNLRKNISIRNGDNTQFIPREHTETSGWIKLLEIFGAFNFAVAGATNAVVNLAQGETEETNPIVEAYRGLTLKDKEVFADVLENLGWEGEDGYAYWSRETLGFVLDVVTDPINFISLGSAQTARFAKGIATNVPLRGTAKLAGKKFNPVEELNKVAMSIVDEGLEALKRGDAFQLGGDAAQKKAYDLAEIVRKNLDPTVELDDVTAAVGEVQEGVARLSLEDSIRQDVNAVFSMLSKHNDVRTLRRLIEEGRGSPEQLSAFLKAVGGDTTGEISHAVLKHFLDMEGKDVTIENVMDFLTNLTGGMRSMIDPGGLQIRAPFTQSGIYLADAQWLDEFALAVETGILKAMGAAAQYTPGPIRNATKAVAEAVAKFGKSASYQVSRAFGANARRSGVLNARLLERQNAIKEAQILAEERTQQTLTWAPDGTDQPLPADLYEVVVDTVLAEQDSAINHLRSGERFFTREAFDAEIERLRRTGDPADAARAEQMELQARTTPPGYTEQHIPLMAQDPRLQGYTPEQIGQLQETVRRIHREFTEVYDESAAHGMAMEFMEYYLPLNYSNWQKVENISLQHGSEFGRVQGEDPFSRVRSLTREEADDMGLVANKNLYAIVYSRLFAAKRAQIERRFVTKLIDDLGVHPGQVGNVLRRMYGPESELGNDLVRVLMSEASYEDLITPENLGVMIPDLDTFKALIQTGKFEQALTWLQGREDLLPLLASGDGSAKFLDAVNSDLNAGLSTVNTFMDSLFSSQGGLLQAEDGITSALAGSIDELEQLITDVGAEEAGAPAIAAVIRQLMKERLEAANIAVPGVTPIDLLQRSSRGSVFEVGAESQADTVRLAVLMNAIDDAEDAGSAIRQKLLQKAPNIEQAVNKAVDDLVERIRAARDVDNSIITDQLEQQILEMALSAVPGISLERFVAKSALFPEGTVAAQATSKLQAIYDLEIRLSDDSITAATARDIQKEIKKKTDEMLAEYARHPEITRWYDTWRKSHGLPPDPNIPDVSRRQELRNHIINAMREAREKAEQSNLSIFRLPVYAPGAQTPQGRARISAIKATKDKIKAALGDNSEKYADMLDLVMSPTTAMPGYHYNPLAAMRSAVNDLYGAQASAVINLIQDTAAALKPHTLVTEIYGAKAKWSGLVRNLVGQPDNLIAQLESLSQATVNRISTALTKIPGMGDETARSLVKTFQTEMDNILVTRMKDDELLTGVHEATLAAFNQLKEGLDAAVVSTEGRDLMLGMIDQMGRQLIESNQVVINLLSRARSVSNDILKLVDNPTAIVAASTDDVIGIVDELVAIRDDLQKKIIQSDEDTRRLLTPNNPDPAGWDQITDAEINSNMLLGEAQQLHDDMRGVFGENQELLDAFERSQLEIAKEQQTRAKAALEAIDRDVRVTEGKVNDLVMQLRFVEQAGERQQEILTRLKPIFLGDDPPEGWILYQNFAELAVIDEFMKGDDFSRVGWVAAAEKVALKGPSDGTLKSWYNTSQVGVAPELPPVDIPEPAAVAKGRKLTDAEKSQLRDINKQILEIAKKGRLTREEADELQRLGKQSDSIQFLRGSTASVSKVAAAEETMSTLSADVVVAIHKDLYKNEGVFSAIRSAARGVGYDAETAIDATLRGSNPDASAQDLYEAFAPTREALREQYGDTITVYRAEGVQIDKPTKNWATTREFAQQFGDNIVEREIPIDSIVAANVTPNGKYHELIVAKDEFIPTTTIEIPEPVVPVAQLPANQQWVETVQRIAAGAPLDPENARIYAAQRRPAFLDQPSPEDLQQALTGVIDSAAPGLLDELGIVAGDIIESAKATARSGTGFGDDTSRLIGRMTEAAFLPDAEVRELAEAIGYERRFIDALIKQIQAKSGVVEGLYAMKTDAGRAAIAPFKTELAQTLQRADLDADTAQELLGNVDMLTSELIVLASSDMAAALNRLSEITGFEPLQMQNLIADLDQATSLISRTNVTQGVKRMLKDINTAVEDLYRPVATALDDVSDARVLNTQGVPEFFRNYLDTHPNDPLAQFLAEGTRLPDTPGVDLLDPAEMSALEDLLRDVNGPDFGESEPLLLQLQNMMNGVEQESRTNTPNRAMYWLHRLKQLNNGTSANGPITQEQANSLLTGLDRYFERGKPQAAADAAKKKLVNERIPEVRSDAARQYESRAVLTNEVQALDEAIPQMESRTFVEDALDYTPEQKAQWRGIYQMQNYLKLQIQRSEQMALHKVLMDLPSRSEMNYLLLRHQLGNLDVPAEQLELINNMRLAGAGRGVMTPEQTRAIDEITTGRRVMLEGAGELAFERAGNPIKTLLNIDIQDMDIDYQAGAVSQQFLKKVQEFLDELPEDQFALLGGSEGRRLIQGEDGSLIVANATEAAGVTTDANASLVNAVAQVHDYLKLVEDTGGAMTGVPALEIQKKQLARALNSFFPGDSIEATDQKRLLLQAVIGHQNIDKLSAAEASAVINYLQTNVKPDVTSFGRSSRASMQRADRVMLGLRDRGLLPRKLEARWQKGELSDEELLREYQKLGSEMDVNDPERPVSLRFPGMARIMENGIDLSGKDLGQPITVPKWMADAVADAVAPEREFGPVLRGMLRSADALTNSFKWAMTLPWPAFHARNIMDATVRSMFALGTKALNPTWNRKVFNIMQGGDEIVTINGVQYRSDVLLEMFEKLGGQVDFADKIGKTAVAMDVTDPRVMSPFSDNFVMRGANSLADTASTIAGKGDNFFRLSIWLKNMEEGMGATDAMAYAQKFLFDYANGLSPFERNVMRRLFPFYTFSRFNVPLQLGLMFKRPGMISLMGKTQNLFSEKRKDPIDTLLPSYVREQWRFGPQINNGQLQIWTGRNLLATEELGFLGDIATWRGQSTPDILFDEVFARLNPMLKIPVELYIGKNLYFDSKIAEDQTIRGAILDWPVIRDYLDMRKVRIGSGADARVLYRVNGYRYHLLNQLHFSRLYRTMVSIFGDEDTTFYQRWVPFITGLRLSSIDLSRRMQHLESVANFNQEKIRKALSQGDFVAAQRILDLTERQPYQQLELEQSVSALEGLVEQTSK